MGVIGHEAIPLASVATVVVHVSVSAPLPVTVKVSCSPAMGLLVLPSVSVPVKHPGDGDAGEQFWPASEYSPLAGLTVRMVGSKTVRGVVVVFSEYHGVGPKLVVTVWELVVSATAPPVQLTVPSAWTIPVQ